MLSPHYYEHRMNSFRKLLKATNTLFGKTNDFFITKFQTCGLPHDCGLLWIENASHFGVLKMKFLKILWINNYPLMKQF